MGIKQILPVDSSSTDDNGGITFTHTIDQPGFYLLIFPGGARLSLLMEKNEHLRISGNLKEKLTDLTISGSRGSELLMQFFRETAKNILKIDSIKSVLIKHEGTDDFLAVSLQADSAFQEIQGDQKKIEEEFIDRNPGSLASLIVLNFSFGQEPVLKMKDDYAYYIKAGYLYKYYPENRHVIYHLKRILASINKTKYQ